MAGKSKSTPDEDAALDALMDASEAAGKDQADGQSQPDRSEDDALLALEELAAGENAELAALDELIGAEAAPSDSVKSTGGEVGDTDLEALEELLAGSDGEGGGGDDRGKVPEGNRQDEEKDALEELVGAEASFTEKKGTEKSADEELVALEEMMAAEQGAGDRLNDSDGDKGAVDEESAALDDLVAVSQTEDAQKAPAGKAGGASKKRAAAAAAGKEKLSEEEQALEDLVAGDGSGKDAPSAKEARSELDDDGIITLKEVVSLGEASGKGPSSSGKPKQRKPIAGKGAKKAQSSFSGALSSEEQDDLETLIKGFRDGSPDAASDVVALQKQVLGLKKRVVQLSKMVARMDRKIIVYEEVLTLYQKKSELMNRRIAQLAAALEEE